MNLGPHAAFIVAAYTAAIVVVGMLIAWVVVDHKAQKRVLGDLDTQGVARRSAPAAKEIA